MALPRSHVGRADRREFRNQRVRIAWRWPFRQIDGSGCRLCFTAALALEPEARAAFLDQNCGSDGELRKEVEALLDASEKPLDFLRQPVLEAAHQVAAENSPHTIAPGIELAHYKVLSLLGAGGMGKVYLAEDSRLKRKVALKMLKPELTRDERGLRRFEKEAASAMNHPNILTIYEFGQVDGLRYIAAELIEGQTALSRNL